MGYYKDLAKKHPEIKDILIIILDWDILDLEKSGLKRERSIIGIILGYIGVITGFPLEETGKSFWVIYNPIFLLRAGPI